MTPKKDARITRAEEIAYLVPQVEDSETRSQKTYALSTVKDQDYILASYTK